jgi:quinol monooxygenase YgiN
LEPESCIKLQSESAQFTYPKDWEVLIMDQVAIWAVVESKPGKENEVEAFLKSAQPLAEREPQTTNWYAVKLGPSKFAIFDTFPDEKGRQAHLTGEIAKALMAKAPELFSKPPEIHQLSILAAKTPKATGAAGGHGD